MSKVIIVRCIRCLKPYNIQFCGLMEYTPQCPHCKAYGKSFEDIMALQPEIKEKLKELK